MTRPLHEIAADIRKHWPNMYFGAVPYVDAMSELNTLNDKYYADSASSVVLYFLSNAATWRGEDARRIKAELKSMLK
jgi:hypothetical protein